MKFRDLHPWDVSPSEAAAIQHDLRERVSLSWEGGEVRLVAGADIAMDRKSGLGFAAVIVFRLPELTVVERCQAIRKLTFPYIPGLLAFREAPVLLEALARLDCEPDLIVFDGQGIAHPRRVGIATHLGIILDRPTIGCAKSRLCGTYEEPGPRVGDHSPLTDGEETLGAVLRTRERVKPVFISPGHKIDLEGAVEVTLRCLDGYRLPKPTREADRYVAALKRGRIGKNILPPGEDIHSPTDGTTHRR